MLLKNNISKTYIRLFCNFPRINSKFAFLIYNSLNNLNPYNFLKNKNNVKKQLQNKQLFLQSLFIATNKEFNEIHVFLEFSQQCNRKLKSFSLNICNRKIIPKNITVNTKEEGVKKILLLDPLVKEEYIGDKTTPHTQNKINADELKNCFLLEPLVKEGSIVDKTAPHNKKNEINDILKWHKKQYSELVLSSFNKFKNTFLHLTTKKEKNIKEDEPEVATMFSYIETPMFEGKQRNTCEPSEQSDYNRTKLTLGDSGPGSILLVNIIQAFLSRKNQINKQEGLPLFNDIVALWDVDEFDQPESLNFINKKENYAVDYLTTTATEKEGINILFTTYEIEPLLKKIKKKKIPAIALKNIIIIKINTGKKLTKTTKTSSFEQISVNICGSVTLYVNSTLQTENFNGDELNELQKRFDQANYYVNKQIFQESQKNLEYKQNQPEGKKP